MKKVKCINKKKNKKEVHYFTQNYIKALPLNPFITDEKTI